ncbi:MAG: RNA polymerase factor sigma-54, partial [Armatimonadota bacterium]
MLNVSGVPAQQPGLQNAPLPQQIVASKVLEMPVDQLDQHLRHEAAQNPALEIPEDPECPFCGTPLEAGECPICNLRALGDIPLASELVQPVQFFDGEYEAEQDPVNRVAEAWSLKQDLLLQLSVIADGQTLEVGEYIIECLTEDGYLLEPLIDIADRFALSVPQVEEVLRVVQKLDPAGIAARDLRECLLLQLERMDQSSEAVSSALAIVSGHWKHLCANRADKIAAETGMPVDEVKRVLSFIQANLTPCPG